MAITDRNCLNDQRQPAPDYWEMPEIAALLRMVTHINIGATMALCVSIAATPFGIAPEVRSAGDTPAGGAACRCERILLVPLAPGAQHIAAGSSPHS